MTSSDEMAGIEYHGIAGATQDCVDAVIALLHFRPTLTEAKILSSNNEHGLLIRDKFSNTVAVKSGFASGYGGGGPTGFSYVLQLLRFHNIEINEFSVSSELLERLDRSCLTKGDLELIDNSRPVRPHHYQNYIFENDFRSKLDSTLWNKITAVLPLGLIDSRISDLTLDFEISPSDALLKGFRRLEDSIRKRIDVKGETGARIFSIAFHGDEAKLYWNEISESEKVGRANLFIGSFMAHRNPLAHTENLPTRDEALSQFLLLNHLFRLEKLAIERTPRDQE